VKKFLNVHVYKVLESVREGMGERWRKLNEAMLGVIEDYAMIRFQPLNVFDEESLQDLLLRVDMTIQYGDDLDFKEPKEQETD